MAGLSWCRWIAIEWLACFLQLELDYGLFMALAGIRHLKHPKIGVIFFWLFL